MTAGRRSRQGADPIVGYVEVHIEQGPVLEDEGLPVGVVSAIVGQTRLRVGLTGRAGHAGTVPAALRCDALAGAAELVLAVEEAMTATSGLVATVGELTVEPGASNVIPGKVDLSRRRQACRRRGPEAALEELRGAATQARGAGVGWCSTGEVVQETASMPMSDSLVRLSPAAIAREGLTVRPLVSGAGHDAVVVGRDAARRDAVRALSRRREPLPLESVDEADVAIALAVLETPFELGSEH